MASIAHAPSPSHSTRDQPHSSSPATPLPSLSLSRSDLPCETLLLSPTAPPFFRSRVFTKVYASLAFLKPSSGQRQLGHCSRPLWWLSIPGNSTHQTTNKRRWWACWASSITCGMASSATARASPTSTVTGKSTNESLAANIRSPLKALSIIFLLVAITNPQVILVEAAVSPTWRAFHGAAIVDSNMIVFGGTTDPTRNPYDSTVPGSNDLWVWSTTLRQWSQPTTQFSGSATSAPAPQKFLTSIALESQGRMMSIVGNATSPSSSLLMLDSYFWVWSAPNSPNPASAPALRLGAAVGTSDSLVFLHGGAALDSKGYATTNAYNDLTKLNANTFFWTSIANGPALMYHTMCKLKGLNMMVIFGGSDSATSAFNTVHTFDLTLEVWVLAVPVKSGIGGSAPSPRKGHTAVCLNNTMIVYGGGPDEASDDDVWVLDASTAQWTWNRMTTKQKGPGARTGHSALLMGTDMLVWGGYVSPPTNDTNIFILDTLTWNWSSSNDSGSTTPIQSKPGPSSDNMPLTIGVICGGFALIVAFIGFLTYRRVTTKRKKDLSQGTSSFTTDNEQQLSRDIVVEDKPSINSSLGKESASSGGRRSPNASFRRSLPHGYPMQSMSAFVAAEKESSRGESSRSSEQKEKSPTSTTGSIGAKVGSVSSGPFYPTHLAEDDEEDADRWTFASSLSIDHRDNNNNLPTLRYIPTRAHGAPSTQRSLGQSTASLGGSSTQRVPMMIYQPGGTRSRRETSGISIRTGNGSSLGPGTTSLAAPSEILGREGSASPREGTLFNSVSPLDRVTLMCSGIDVGQPNENDALVMSYPKGGSINLQQSEDNQESQGIMQERRPSDLRRKDTTSTSTTKSSTTYTTLDNPALVALVQNLPARYKLLKSPSPIHGETNDILFAIDSDTQQPIVIKSFTRKEAWERECRILRRLRGPYVVELKHVATLVLSETDEPSRPAKVRLTILERLDETLAQMLKNARKAKKVSLREQAPSGEVLDLTGPGLYKSGTSLDEGYIKDIVKGVLQCLSWCHSKKAVYCDLKPSNVMHNRDDPRQQWKLIDMESSRAASEECIGIGTVRYCPPEVARGTTVDKQASFGVTANYSIDLWAFGCLVYELFATRPLFPLSLSDDTVLHFLAHPSADTPALANGLRWGSNRQLEIPHFEQAVPDANARALIRMLLHPDPQRRANINHVLASDYLCLSPEADAPYKRTSTSGSRSPPPVISPSQFQQQLQDPAAWTVGCFLRKNPCFLMPLPNQEESSSWLDPSTWTMSSFRLHYLCQHSSEDTGSELSFGHYVRQPGHPIPDPLSLFKDLAPLLLMSLNLQLVRSEQCPPGFETLGAFEYSPDSDQATFDLQESSTAGAVKPGVVKGFVGYLQWMRCRIQQLTLTSSPASAVASASGSPISPSSDRREEIKGSLQVLQVYSEAVKGPNSNRGVPAGLRLISRGINQNQESILICDGHVPLPQYSKWTTRT